MPSAPGTLGAIRGPVSQVRKQRDIQKAYHAVWPQPTGQRATRGAGRGPSQDLRGAWAQGPGVWGGAERAGRWAVLCGNNPRRPAEPAWPGPGEGRSGVAGGKDRETAVPFLLGCCQQSLGWAAFLQLGEESQGDVCDVVEQRNEPVFWVSVSEAINFLPCSSRSSSGMLLVAAAGTCLAQTLGDPGSASRVSLARDTRREPQCSPLQ